MGWLLCSLPLAVFSQSVNADADALVTWMDEYVNLPAAPGIDELPKYSPGWFSELEIRTETDEFMLTQQRFALRGDPKMPHVRRAERRIQNAQRAGLSSLGDDLLTEGRADALALLFELATDIREAQLIDTLFDVQSRLVEVTRRRVIEPGYDVEKILDAEDDLAALTLRKKELRTLAKTVKSPVLPRSLVQLEDIRFRLVAIASEGPAKTPGQAATLEQIDAEMALERAENTSFLKFLQVQYSGSSDPDDLTRELVSVGGSIAFPRRERNIRQLDKLKVERLEEIYDYELKLREREREFNEAVVQLQRMFTEHDDLKVQQISRRERRNRLGQTYLQSSQARPESLLRLSRRNLSDRLSLLQLEEDIREGYAALLGDFLTLDAQGVQRWVLK